MAQKDADMASDYKHASLHLYAEKRASFYVEFNLVNDPDTQIEELFLLDVVPGGSGQGKTYRMRGFDTNVSVDSIVYWDSTGVDTNAEDYAGSAGPVINVIISDIVGD